MIYWHDLSFGLLFGVGFTVPNWLLGKVLK